MGNETVLVGSAGSSTVGSNGSVVTFPSGAPGPGADSNVFRDQDVTGVRNLKVFASLSASANYSMRLVASFTDSSTGSSFNGVVEQFAPGDTRGDGAGREVFYADGPHEHFTGLEIENGSAGSTLTVGELAVVWESSNG